MNTYSALFIGGSAGSLDVLLRVIPDLKPTINFSIVLILHRKQGSDHLLRDLLESKSQLPVKEINEKEQMIPGSIFIAPSDYHLLIERDHSFSLDYSEKVNYSRPSIDVTFASAAEIFKHKLACLLLSGSNADGVFGLQFVQKLKGLTLAQNPEEASVAYMPETAINAGFVNKILNVAEMASFINNLNQNNG